MSRRRYRSEYVDEAMESPPVRKESVTVPETVYGTIAHTSCVKVRESPSPDSKVIAFYKNGLRVIVDPRFKGDYVKVWIPKKEKYGYIASSFCEVD